jgi:hypothetical protein
MKDKVRFFNEAFKVLGATAASMWVLYFSFLLFVGDSAGCAVGSSGQLFGALALVAGLLSAIPLIQGLLRLLFWPTGQKVKGVWTGGWIVGCGIAIFVIALILFAIAASQYGCG